MGDRNEVIIEGNLTRDPELKYTSGGKALCKFTVAWNNSYKKGNEWIKESNFFDATAWGETAEGMTAYHKGNAIHVEGSLKQEHWEKDGKQNSRVCITAWKIEPIARTERAGNNSPTASSCSQANNGRPNTANFKDDVPDDGVIPF